MLLTFEDFPPKHWEHFRTTPPESTFATVRLQTARTKGCPSRKRALTMVFKLSQAASQKWRHLDCANQIGALTEGVSSKDGEEPNQHATRNARHQTLTMAQRLWFAAVSR